MGGESQVSKETLELAVSAKRMWAAVFEDAHNILPKALPHLIASVDYPSPQPHAEGPGQEHEGGRGWFVPGGLRVITYRLGDALQKHIESAKEAIQEEATTLITMEEAKLKDALEKHNGPTKGAIQEEAAPLISKGEVKAQGTLESYKESTKGDIHEDEARITKEETKVETLFQKLENSLEKDVKTVGEASKVGVEKVGDRLHSVGKNISQSIEKIEESIESLFHGQMHYMEERIDDIEYDALKITVSTIGGVVMHILMKKVQHSFEFKDKGNGSIVNWTTEFEALSEHLLNPNDMLKKHYMETLKNVEAYLLGHDDYIHHH